MQTTVVSKQSFFLHFIVAILLAACGKESEPGMPDLKDPAVRSHMYQRVGFEVRLKSPSELDHFSENTISENEANGELPMVFEMRISPGSQAKGDVMMNGVSDLDEFKQRMETLNFHLGQSIYIKNGRAKIFPRLVHMENTYGLTDYRLVQIAFDPKDIGGLLDTNGELDLVFRDPVFDTGLSHFIFGSEAILTSKQ